MHLADWPEDAVEVGRILGAFGVKGWIKVQPFSFDASALSGSTTWWLDLVRPGQAPRQLLKVLAMRQQGEDLVAQIEGVDDRSAAEMLRGGVLSVPRTAFPKTADGEYYWIDLIGLDVVNREGVHLGVVRDLMPTGPTSVLVMEYTETVDGVEKTAERLVPFVAAYIDDVDLKARRITADWQTDY